MANRFNRSFYRFSTANRPVNPAPTTTSTQESGEGRHLPAATKYQPAEPRSPAYSPTRDSVPPSPTYSAKKGHSSPPLSPPYRATRTVTSPAKAAAESPKYRRPRSPPEVDQKPVIYKPVEKPTKSDRYVDSAKSSMKSSAKSSEDKQLPNSIRIAGENVGAIMEIVESQNKREGGGHVIKKKETRGAHHIGGENDDASKDKAGVHKGNKETTSLPNSTFMNSNFQSVNNSLLYNASIAHHDPGLHLSFSRNPNSHASAIDDHKKLKEEKDQVMHY